MALFDAFKAKATEVVNNTLQESVRNAPTPRQGQREQTPFVGFETDEHGKVLGRADSLSHTAVFGGSGSGKTVSVLVPQICMWDGPVFAVSAKSDLAEYSASIRAQRGGPIYMMDLTGQADWNALPEGVIPLINDPCALLVPDADGSTDDSALDLAKLLTEVGTLGMGGGKGAGGDVPFWMTLALGTLACLLQAGAGYPDPETGAWADGGGIDWVMKAALNTGDDDEGSGDDLDLDTPSWSVAEIRADLAGSAHAADIPATKALDPKQRDSVGINLRVALSSWKKKSVRGTGTPFTPELLEDPNATMYLVSPSSGGAAAAATSIVESIVAHWTQHSIRKSLPKISMVIDECPQICPIPRLREHIGLMRSYGCWFTVAAQHSSQFTARFGKEEMDALLQVYPCILIMVGAIEKDILDQAAWTVKTTERRIESQDHAGRTSTSIDQVKREPAELLPRHRGEGRLLVRGLPGTMVKLVPFDQMVA